MEAYLVYNNVELEVRGFYNEYNAHGARCLMCICYLAALDSVENIPASMIEIR